MSRCSDEELVPRNGHTLIVGIGARISGCANQKEMSLDDQVDHAKEVVAEYWSGPVDYAIVQAKGKGEDLTRPELAMIEEAYRSGKLDLFVFEDLGRLIRGAEASRLLGIGIDHGVRTLIPNDCIDTADETWESDALEASASHVAHNAHTSRRLKKKLMNRFRKFGGAPGRPIAGYIVPQGVKTYADWQRDETLTPLIQEGARRLLEKLHFSAVADLFNSRDFPVGPYHRKSRWDGKMVRSFYLNPLLKGMPERGNRCTVKKHETGRRVSVHNPKGPSTFVASHLAHLDPAEFDLLKMRILAGHAQLARHDVNGADPRKGVSRKRTCFPGQWSRCWYCGHHHVWGGNGITDHLMCSASRDWRCWNSIGYDGTLAVQRVQSAITSELYQLDAFDAQLQAIVRDAQQSCSGQSNQRWGQIPREQATLAHQKQNLVASMAEYGPLPAIKQKLAEIEAAELKLQIEHHALQRLRDRSMDLPATSAQLRERFDTAFAAVANGSYEAGDLLRKIVPDIHVYLVRLCDGGHLLPRAKVTLSLTGLVPDARQAPDLEALTRRELTLDLFVPPQREQIREECVRLFAQGMGPKAIAEKFAREAQSAASGQGLNAPTATAVQKALALDRKMKQLGLNTPYVVLKEPPADYPKLRRHRNAKYRFSPLDGYTPPEI